jgi:AraC family transcriptional regulator
LRTIPDDRPDADPLAAALRRQAERDEPGTARGRVVAAGDGWRVVDIVCTAGPDDRPFEERQAAMSISLVLSGTFVYRTARGASLMAPGALLLGNVDEPFECSHAHGRGDRCLSFQFEPEAFARLAHEAGGASRFTRDRVPPLRALAPLAVRARTSAAGGDGLDEVALQLGAAVARLAAAAPRTPRAPDDAGRIAGVLRRLEAAPAEPHPLAELARAAGQSRFHFLRTFAAVTGITPHQWLLRARLRAAAERLATTDAPVTTVAYDAGFGDLSHFIRTFRAEFGVPPSRYRGRA